MFTLGFQKVAVSVKWIAKKLSLPKHSERIQNIIRDRSEKATTLMLRHSIPPRLESLTQREARLSLVRKASRMKRNNSKLLAAGRRYYYDRGRTESKKAILEHLNKQRDINHQVAEKMRERFGPKGSA